MGNENSAVYNGSTHVQSNSYPGSRSSDTATSSQNHDRVNHGRNSNRSNTNHYGRSGMRFPDSAGAGAFAIPGTHRGVHSRDIPHRVTVPQGIKPGQQFPVTISGVQMVVTCPPNVRPGEEIMVTVPGSQIIPQSGQPIYSTHVPQGVQPGQQFRVVIDNRQVYVTCPPGVSPGSQIRIRLPEQAQKTAPTSLRTFEVTIPQGVKPGEPFALLAHGQQVMVHCPHNKRPGQKMRFNVPIQLSENELKAFSIKYKQEGWIRYVGSDLKFHWVKHESEQNKERKKDLGDTFDVQGSAYVRRMFKARSGNNDIDLIKAEDVALDASIPMINVNFQMLSKVSNHPFNMKVQWFRHQCEQLRIPWEVEHQHIRVNRENLLGDSIHALESIQAHKLRQKFKFEFIGEEGVDSGGLAREWYQLNSEAIFNPNFALFQYCSINQMCMQINPDSGIANEEHLQYFHFAGRLLGKALFDGHLIPSHMVRPLYKHILAWPVSFSDLEYVDNFRHDSLLKMVDMEDVSLCEVDFTMTESKLGENRSVELIPGGEHILVTNENLSQYMELVFKRRILFQVKDQLRNFLEGFYDIIPQALLTIFDFQELELIMCGLPTINLEDWKANTEYTGTFEKAKSRHEIVQWFWEILENFETVQQARLLQFVTGSSGVPALGFSVLQGSDGNIKKFTLNGCTVEQTSFPRAHTCFNRIDMPMYESKEDLRERLSLVINMECTGFGIE